MKTCPRCNIPKPDASFAKNGPYGGDSWPHCTQCRGRGWFHIIPAPSRPPLTPSEDSIRLIEVAREERRAFEARGARQIDRPYVEPLMSFRIRKHQVLF